MIIMTMAVITMKIIVKFYSLSYHNLLWTNINDKKQLKQDKAKQYKTIHCNKIKKAIEQSKTNNGTKQILNW